MSVGFYIGLLLSGAVGVSLGLIGAGGSILTVPILVYFFGVEPHEAVGMSLAVVGTTSLFGSYLHHQHSRVNFPAAMLFGITGIFGAFFGAPLTKFVLPEVLLLLFGALMLVVAISMLWRKRQVEGTARRPKVLWKAAAAGFGVGFLTGFLGVGGGFLIVPALVLFGGLAIKEAVGTSLFVIFINCTAGLIAHAGGSHFNWSLTTMVVVLAVGGASLGTIFSHRLSANRLQKAFAVLVLAVSVVLLAKNYMVLF